MNSGGPTWAPKKHGCNGGRRSIPFEVLRLEAADRWGIAPGD